MSDPLIENRFARVPKGTVTILYLHGCTGIAPDNRKDFKMLARSGFLVIAPNSLVRQGRKSNCDPKTRQSGYFPDAHYWRMAEIKYAVGQLKNMPGVDPNKLVLMGHSEGARAAGNWKGREFRAIVTLGWSCKSIGSNFIGLQTDTKVPTMNVVSREDEWVPIHIRGTCEHELRNHQVKEVVSPPGKRHWINDDPQVYARIEAFIRDNAR